MKTWAEFIEREAGHVTTGLVLIIVGAILVKTGIPKSEDLIPFALGIIARSMIGDKRNLPPGAMA